MMPCHNELSKRTTSSPDQARHWCHDLWQSCTTAKWYAGTTSKERLIAWHSYPIKQSPDAVCFALWMTVNHKLQPHANISQLTLECNSSFPMLCSVPKWETAMLIAKDDSLLNANSCLTSVSVYYIKVQSSAKELLHYGSWQGSIDIHQNFSQTS